MRVFSLLAMLVVANGLCVSQGNCDNCVSSTSSIGTNCVWCKDKNSCTDPAASILLGCQEIQFGNAQCANGDYVAPIIGTRAVAGVSVDEGNSFGYISSSVQSNTLNVIELRVSKGSWTGSPYDNFPAVSLKALSPNHTVGSEFFDLTCVFEAVAEWDDSNNNNAVDVGEIVLANAFSFRTGYTWTLDNGNSGNFYWITLTGTQASSPTLFVNCSMTDKDGSQLGAIALAASEIKCDISLTDLVLLTKTNGWAFRAFLVAGSVNLHVTGQPATASGSGNAAGFSIDVGASGSFSWVDKAGTTVTGRDIGVVFGGSVSGTAYAGSGFIDVAEANFGFPNPTPGSDFSIYWDPAMQAPESGASSAAVTLRISSLAIVALIVLAKSKIL